MPVRRRFGAGVAYALWWLVPVAWLALLLPVLVLPCSSALGADPVLTILFSSNAEGNYAPCPS